VGQTEGAMPVTSGVYSNPNSGQFICKLDKNLSSIIFSTVFGNGNGMPNISPAAFLIDECENIYVSGWGGNIITSVPTTGMPVTTGAYQTTTDGYNFYLFVLTANASSLFYATYFGGASSREHVDGGTSRFDKKGIVYQSVCAGCGGNDDFPVTPGSWPYTSSGYSTSTGINFATNCNNGTFKFDFQVPPVHAQFSVNNVSGCSPYSVTFNNLSTSWQGYLWNFGNGDTSTVLFNPTVTYVAPGNYFVSLVVNNGTCHASDTAITNITVYPPFVSNFDFITTPCSDNVAFVDSSYNSPSFWLWNFDDGTSSSLQNPSHLYSSGGTYNVQLISHNALGCGDTTIIQLDLATPIVTVNPSTSICTGLTTQLNATGGFSYQWAPSAGLNSTTIANPTASPAATTTYTVTITSVTLAGDTCTTSISTTVSVYSPSAFPLLATADKDTIYMGTSTTLHANTDTTLTIIWSPATGVSNPYSFNPTVAPLETTTYTVTITDSSGCPKSSTITIYVISMKCTLDDAFVPNTFTPNGDGQNDLLFVRSISLSEMYFAVYNRWGELVFESNDLKKGWDGIYKGKPSDPDVFAWYLTAKCYSGEEMKKKGNVTLIR
jgi:gliding motility-associated-like protein